MFGMQPHAFYSSEHQSDLLRKASGVLKVFFSLPCPFFFLFLYSQLLFILVFFWYVVSSAIFAQETNLSLKTEPSLVLVLWPLSKQVIFVLPVIYDWTDLELILSGL